MEKAKDSYSWSSEDADPIADLEALREMMLEMTGLELSPPMVIKRPRGDNTYLEIYLNIDWKICIWTEELHDGEPVLRSRAERISSYD